MPDPNEQFERVVPPVAPPVETPPAPTPPPEPLDESGVPYKNRVAEYQRKLNEAAERERLYQIALGNRVQQPAPPAGPTAPPSDDLAELEKQFDAPTQKFVRGVVQREARKIAEEIAQQTGYRMMTQATHQTVLSQDQELLSEAQRQYQALKNNPLWANVDDTLVQDRAIAEARAIRGQRAPTQQQQTPVQQQRQVMPNNTSLPLTTPAAAAAPASDKEKWIGEYLKQPETLETFRRFYRGIAPDSEEGKKILREVAEEAWGGTKFTGAVAVAYRSLQSGDSGMLGKVEEVR